MKVDMQSRFKQGNFFFLLGGLCLLLLTAPALSGLMGPYWALELEIPASSLLIVGVWSLSGSRRFLYLGIALVAVCMLSIVLFFVFHWAAARWLTLLSVLIFLVLSSIMALRLVLRPGPVDANKIVGAVCVYLMIGVFLAVLYYLLQSVVPGSFNGLESYSEPQWFWRLLYFSFVTLSTLGYGDITPANAYSESMAYFEAIIGQFYIAIVVAGLVGSYMSGQDSPEAKIHADEGER